MEEQAGGSVGGWWAGLAVPLGMCLPCGTRRHFCYRQDRTGWMCPMSHTGSPGRTQTGPHLPDGLPTPPTHHLTDSSTRWMGHVPPLFPSPPLPSPTPTHTPGGRHRVCPLPSPTPFLQIRHPTPFPLTSLPPPSLLSYFFCLCSPLLLILISSSSILVFI